MVFACHLNRQREQENSAVRFINALRLKTKLQFLFFLISLGLILIGIIGYFNISAMKKNLDDLYFGSFIPVNELNEIIQTYHKGIELNVLKVKNGVISPFEASAELSAGLDRINRAWKAYAGHYKSKEELSYVSYSADTVKAANRYVEQVIDICHQRENVHNLSNATLFKTIERVQSVLGKLVKYETDVAREERRHLLVTYDSTLYQLIVTLVLIIGGVLLLSYAIFKSIQMDQRILELASKKLKRANEQLRSASYTDSLTGLNNRRYFNIIYDRELKRAKRTGSYFTFMMLDIDYFKLYNDSYGHLEGDKALIAVGKILHETLKRPGDYLFRLGGEEFGIIITETDPENSQMMAEKICREVENLKIAHLKNRASNYVTVSIGVTTLIPSVSLNDEVILSEADENLYKAKENGRNQYVVSSGFLKKKHVEPRERAA